MPFYEYYCPTCKETFELRRPIEERDAPALCSQGHDGAQRALSKFISFSKMESGYLTYELDTHAPPRPEPAGND